MNYASKNLSIFCMGIFTGSRFKNKTQFIKVTDEGKKIIRSVCPFLGYQKPMKFWLIKAIKTFHVIWAWLAFQTWKA